MEPFDAVDLWTLSFIYDENQTNISKITDGICTTLLELSDPYDELLGSLKLLKKNNFIYINGFDDINQQTFFITNEGKIFYKKLVHDGILSYLNKSPDTTKKKANKISEKLRKLLSDQKFPLGLEKMVQIINTNAIPLVSLVIELGSKYFINK